MPTQNDLEAEIARLTKECDEIKSEAAELAADLKRAMGENERMRAERDELYGYVNGLLGLLQLVCSRDDMPKEIGEVLRTNHRATDAAAYLTQIVPPIGTEQLASEQCSQCGAEIVGFHRCPGLPGENEF